MSKAQLCVFAKRAGIEAAVGYSDAGQTVIGNDCDEVPFGIQGWLGIAYQFIGQPERSVEWYRAELARGRDTHASTRACLVIGLAGVMGSLDEALPAMKGLIDAAEATGNPYVLSFALMAYGTAFRDADPDRARAAMRRGVVIAQDSGNGFNESHLVATLARWKPNTAIRWPRSNTPLWQSATSMTPATAPRSVAPWLSSPPFSTGSGATNLRPPSLVSRPLQ